MNVSICMSNYGRPEHLDRTLESIFKQTPEVEFECIVVDDKGPESPEVIRVCERYPVHFLSFQNEDRHGNPAKARNVAYQEAKGQVIIAQSSDVMHATLDTIQKLYDLLHVGQFVISRVVNVNEQLQPYAPKEGDGYGDRLVEYVGPQNRRPLFFLGALYRKDLYTIGGNDEEFVYPSREDVWFSDCLIHGLGLTPRYTLEVLGFHQDHDHTQDRIGLKKSRDLYQRKAQQAKQTGIWQAASGPWPLPNSLAPYKG